MCACFHIKPLFVPVDIQHTQCPCRFFLLERYKLCGHKTTTEILHCTTVRRVDNAMTCHRQCIVPGTSSLRATALRYTTRRYHLPRPFVPSVVSGLTSSLPLVLTVYRPFRIISPLLSSAGRPFRALSPLRSSAGRPFRALSPLLSSDGRPFRALSPLLSTALRLLRALSPLLSSVTKLATKYRGLIMIPLIRHFG